MSPDLMLPVLFTNKG